MHDIEPFYHWREIYNSEEDPDSPFYGREHSEFYFKNSVYNYLIHPQWDEFDSETLYIKILYADYDKSFVVIELIGEWNDLLYNDIMKLKRNVIDELIALGISKYVLLMDYVMNFHADDDSYYEEWFEDCEEGWIVFLNVRDHIIQELENARLDSYINYGGSLESIPWRKLHPLQLLKNVETIISRRLN